MGWAGVGLLLGAGVQLQQASLWPWRGYAEAALRALGPAWAGALLGPAIAARRTAAVAWLLAAALAGFASAGLRAARFEAQALPAALEGQDLVVTGVIAAMPQRGEWGQRLRFRVESATRSGELVRLPPLLQLGWWSGRPQAPAGAQPSLRAGDRWQLAVRLKAPHGQRNPHGFDLELWLWEQGIQATGSVRTGLRDPAPRHLGATGTAPVEGLRQALRDALFERVADPARAGVLAALAMGDQQAIDREGWDLFRATGVAHLMSISGLHVTLFAWGAAAVLGGCWRRSARLCHAWPAQHAALAGGVLLAAAYAVFSGWGVPAQRTVGMLATVALLRLAGLHWPWPQVWLLTAAVIVTADPWALVQAGFWLSFVAVGVLFATGAGPRPAGLAARLRALLREQALVTLALAPLTLLLFGQVSLVGLAANLLAIPWVTLVVTPLALAGTLLPPLWVGGGWGVEGVGMVLRLLAQVPGAVLALPVAPWWAGVAGMAGALLMVLRWPLSLRALGLLLFLPMLSWPAPRPQAGRFELLAADVGQGNAVLVRTARHTLLYDAGPRYGPDSDAGDRVLVPLLRARGERLDRLVVSHRDSDHSGGAAAVLALDEGTDLLASLEDGHPLASMRQPLRCEAGLRWTWDGVAFEILHPLAGDHAVRGARPNTLSCVLRVQAAGAQGAVALLAGDIEAPQERSLLAREGEAGRLRAELLLVPHHGSKTSSSEAFLEAVQPRIALVQAGYRNRFGHPAQPVLDRYAARGSTVVVSPACGAAYWRSAEPGQVGCERERARRYWHHRP